MLIKLRRDRAFFDLRPQGGHVVAPSGEHLHLALDIGDHLIDRRGLLGRLKRLEDVDLALHVLLDPVVEALVGLLDGLDRFLLRLGACLGRLRQILVGLLEIAVGFGQRFGGLSLCLLLLFDLPGGLSHGLLFLSYLVGSGRSLLIDLRRLLKGFVYLFLRGFRVLEILLELAHLLALCFHLGARIGARTIRAALVVGHLLVDPVRLIVGILRRLDGVLGLLGVELCLDVRGVRLLGCRQQSCIHEGRFLRIEESDDALPVHIDRAGVAVKSRGQLRHRVGQCADRVLYLVEFKLRQLAACCQLVLGVQDHLLVGVELGSLRLSVRDTRLRAVEEPLHLLVGVLDALHELLQLRFLRRQGICDPADHARGGLHKTAQRALDIGIEPDAQALQRGVEALHVALQVVGHRDPHVLSGSGGRLQLLGVIGKSGFAVLCLTGEPGHDHLQIRVVALPGDRFGHAGLLLLRQGRPDPGHPAEDIRQTRHVALGVVDADAVLLQG